MKCARIACDNTINVLCKHTQSGRFYCPKCARKINDHSPGLVEWPPFWHMTKKEDEEEESGHAEDLALVADDGPVDRGRVSAILQERLSTGELTTLVKACGILPSEDRKILLEQLTGRLQ